MRTKARFTRSISAILHSIQRIKFDRNLTSESAAAFLQHVRLVLSHCSTEMRHRISAMSKLVHNILSMRKFGPTKEKEETWPFSFRFNLNILQNELLHCQPTPSHSIVG